MKYNKFLKKVVFLSVLCTIFFVGTAPIQANAQQQPTENSTIQNSSSEIQIETLWNRTYSGQLVLDTAETGDGSHVLNSVDFGENGSSELIGISTDGAVQWRNDLAVGKVPWSVNTANDGYIATGQFENQSRIRWRYAMYGSGGETVWERQLGNGEGPSSLNDMAFDALEMTNGGYLVAGRARQETGEYEKGAITKVNAEGETLWNESYNSIGATSIRTISSTAESEYMIGGYGKLVWGESGVVAKVDSTGSVVWNRSMQHTIDHIERVHSDQYLLVGRNSTQGHLTLIDSTGDSLWNQSYPNTMFMDAIELPGDKFMIVGQTSGTSRNATMRILSAEGRMIFNKTYSSNGNRRLASIEHLGGNKYLLAGSKTVSGEETSYAFALSIGQNSEERIQENLTEQSGESENLASVSDNDGTNNGIPILRRFTDSGTTLFVIAFGVIGGVGGYAIYRHQTTDNEK